MLEYTQISLISCSQEQKYKSQLHVSNRDTLWSQVYFMQTTSRWCHHVSNQPISSSMNSSIQAKSPLHISRYKKKIRSDVSHVHRRTASYQLFTCKRVRFVCAAICLFSSSVGYGCWKNTEISLCLTSHVETTEHWNVLISESTANLQ